MMRFVWRARGLRVRVVRIAAVVVALAAICGSGGSCGSETLEPPNEEQATDDAIGEGEVPTEEPSTEGPTPPEPRDDGQATGEVPEESDDEPTTLTATAVAAPSYAVRFADGTLRSYGEEQVSDGRIDAGVAYAGDDQWELTLTAKAAAVTEVWFPYDAEPVAVDKSRADDVVYYPYRTGVAEQASAAEEEWWGEAYPGRCFSPLVVVADKGAGRIIAATNWPPRQVTPVYRRGRIALRYDDRMAAGETRRFRALVADVRGDASAGADPWRLALDLYKSWLSERMHEARLLPIQYPPALRTVNGWMHVSLHWLAKFEADEVRDLRRLYVRYGNVFPWFQFWGQMSNYQRLPAEGRSDWPEPPLEAGEKTGCCVDRPEMHRRYLPELPLFAAEIVRNGGIVGYYIRPKSPYGDLSAREGADLRFVKNWIAENQRRNANACYLDVLGAWHFGDPLTVARYFYSEFPRMSVIEWPVDVYPAAFLISGSLWGGFRFGTEPGQTPADFDGRFTRVTFPRFGRYVLDHQIMFLGRSNGDFMWWGKYRGHDHWTERQVFMLGAKFDAPTLFKGHRGWIEPVNAVVQMIVDEWERVGWWERRPVYRDRAGISAIPGGVDVRRFVDKEGVNLFTVDNPRELASGSFSFEGRRVAFPARRLSIVVLEE